MSWKDPYSLLDDCCVIKTVLASLILFKLVIGSYLLIVATLFERYGGDPQKRGLMNQVLSEEISNNQRYE